MKHEKVAIRLRTMAGFSKVYEVESWGKEDGELVMNGKNITTGHDGEFRYPLVNIEHYNIVREYENIHMLK